MTSVLSILFLGAATVPLLGQAHKATANEWRRDADKFHEILLSYQKTATKDKQFPQTSLNFLNKGGAVPAEWEVMRLYGGQVEWQGTFKKFETDGLPDRPPRTQIIGKGLIIHLYPQTANLSRWKALTAETPVRYRGQIEGIAGFAIPGKENAVIFIVSIKEAVLLSK